MATILTDTQPLARIGAAPRDGTVVPAALAPCLVLSADDDRCQWFDEAASREGWEAVLCQDDAQASRQLARHPFPLVVVDLESASEPIYDDFQQVAGAVARPGGPLLVVCGSLSDPLQEIWARQLGVWVYLAGVDPTCDLTTIYREARGAAQKLFPYLAPLRASRAAPMSQWME